MSRLIARLGLCVLSFAILVTGVMPANAQSVVATVAVGANPSGIAVNSTTGKVYVAIPSANSVTVIDAANNYTTSSISVGTNPQAIGINPATNTIYVVNKDSSNVSVIDGASGTVKATVTVGPQPFAIAVNSTNNKAYVLNNYKYIPLSIIDGATNTASTMGTNYIGSGVVVNERANKIYVYVAGSNFYIINGATNSSQTASFSGQAMAASTRSNKTYAVGTTTAGAGQLAEIDGTTDAWTISTINPYSVGVAVNDISNKIFTLAYNTVMVVDGVTKVYDPIVVVPTGTYNAKSIVANPNTNKAYLLVGPSNSVYVIDGTLGTSTQLAVGANPTSAAVDSATNKIYVANAGDGTVSVIDDAPAASSTTLAINSYPNPALTTDTIHFTAYLTTTGSRPPIGTVAFRDGAATLGTVSLDTTTKTASFTTTLGVGTHSITAVYSGDGYNAESTSAAMAQVVNQAMDSTTTTVLGTPNPVYAGATTTLTATVRSAGTHIPTGTVTFSDGVTVLGTGTLNGSGVATFSTSFVALGSHTINASYAGDTYNTASSGTTSVTVSAPGPVVTSIVVTSDRNPVALGEPVTFTAKVTSTSVFAPTGTVTFASGPNALGTVSLDAAGVASLSVANLVAGTHSITATYSGDAYNLASTSPELSQVISTTSVDAVTIAAAAATGIVVNEQTNKIYLAPTTGAVLAIDGATNDKKTVPLPDISGSSPNRSIAVNSALNRVYVAAWNGNTDYATFEIDGSKDTAAYGGPMRSAQIAVNPKTNSVYMVDDGWNDVAVARYGYWKGWLPAYTGREPFGIAINSVTNKAYVANRADGTVTVIDGASVEFGNPATTTVTVGGDPRLVAVNESTNKIYVTNWGSNDVTVIDGQTNTTTTVTVGTNPYAIALNAVTNKIYVANTADGTITVIDGVTNTTTTIPVGLRPWAIAINPVTNKIYVANLESNTVTVIDGNTNTPGTVAVGAGPNCLAVNTLTNRVYVGHSGENSIRVIDSNVVVRPPTYATMTVDKSPSALDETINFVVTVTGSGTTPPTGTITFTDSATYTGPLAVVPVDASGTAVYATSALGRGWHTITASYSGDDNNGPSIAPTLTQIVNAPATVTTIYSSANPVADGSRIGLTFFAQVSGTGPHAPTGNVEFDDGTGLHYAAVDENGIAVYSPGMQYPFTIGVGTHVVTAAYVGDEYNARSTSDPLIQIVTASASNTTTTVAASANTIQFGNTVTLTATVTSTGTQAPTGTVTFKDATTVLGVAPLNGSGVATLTSPALSVGMHPIVATYSGDATNDASGSFPFTVIVTPNPGSTTIGLTSDHNPAASRTPVTFTAVIVPTGTHPATGMVTFKDGANVLGTASLNASGVASFTVYTLATGTHSITASYAGDSYNNASTSAVVSQGIFVPSQTTTVLTASSNSALPGTAVTFTAIVSTAGSHTPTGDVKFVDDATSALLGTAALNASGAATLTTSTLVTGSHLIRAIYPGDTNNAASTSAVITETISSDLSSTTTMVGFSPALTITFGTTLTLQGSVSTTGTHAPTGSMVFKDGTTILGQVPLSPSGSASFATYATGTLAVGNHDITAEYWGDTYNAPSASWSNRIVVQKGNTTAALSATPNPADAGTTVTFTATLTTTGGRLPSGNITIIDGKTMLFDGPLDASGTATYTTSGLIAGTHSVYVHYEGDAYNSYANSPNLSVVINPTTSPVPMLTSISPASVAAGASNLTVTINGSNFVPGSMVQWNGSSRSTRYVSSTQLTVTLIAADLATTGTGTITVFNPTPGGGTSSAQTFTITAPLATTTTVLAASVNPVQAGNPVTFTATVTTTGSTTPTGTITFKDGAALLGTATLNASGIATYTAASLPAGSHSIVAVYAGDADNAGSTSTSLTETVNTPLGTSTVILTASANPVQAGTPVTLTAVVTTTGSSTPTGSVTFKDGQTVLGTATLNAAGLATYTLANASAGSHEITAEYAGDTSNAAGTSAVLALSVKEPLGTATIVLTESASPVPVGTPITLTATVTTTGTHTPTGTVTVYDNWTPLGTVTLNASGVAAYTTSNLTAGTHLIAATYSGDTYNTVATSSTMAIVVENSGTTTTTLSANANSVQAGSTVVFTAAVTTSGSHSPTGTVTFKDGGTTLGSSTLISGVATYSTSALATGTHSITAAYNGDTNNTASTSAAITIQVTAVPDNTTTALVSSLNPATTGAAVTFTATVTTAGTHTPTGTVNFSDGATSLGTGTLNVSGVATFTTSALTVGSHSITAAYAGDTNNHGSTSSALTQVVNAPDNPAPTLTSITPSSGNAGSGGFTLTVDGANFISGSVVKWNGSSRNTTYVSATQLLATITDADVATAGTASVTVFNPAPGGGNSTAKVFTIAAVSAPIPVILTVSPGVVKAGAADFTLTVTGSYFAPGATILWNGSPRTTSTAPQGGLQATITASDVATARTVDITVSNPSTAGGGTSAAVKFVIDPVASSGISVTSNTTAVNVAPGQSVTVPVSLSGVSANATITVTCLNLPANASCSFANNVVTVTTSASTPVGTYPVVAIFQVTQQVASAVHGKALLTMLGLMITPVGFFGILGSRKRARLMLLALAALLLSVTLVGCGGAPKVTNPPPATKTTQASIAFDITVK